MSALRFVFFGRSITSSWGHGHATTYRALLRALSDRGHDVTFLERDLPHLAQSRDLPAPAYARTSLYRSLEELFDSHHGAVCDADMVVVGSFVPDGARIGAWVQSLVPGRAAFYDMDTAVTLGALATARVDYLTPALVAGYALYLSFSGGPTLGAIEEDLGATIVRALPCSADPADYFPAPRSPRIHMGYLGTYRPDRQAALDELLIQPARCVPGARFIVAGVEFPAAIAWPDNVERVAHVAASDHRAFYGAQRFTLSVTRAPMVEAGWSPSVRLFEAAACGTPIITDAWPGIDDYFAVGREILVARSADDIVRILHDTSTDMREEIGQRARRRFLAEHTPMHRAEALEGFTREALDRWARRRSRPRGGVSSRSVGSVGSVGSVRSITRT
jgi:spore maturation protein CgeB